jgi:uncharacterized protein YjdB
MNTYKNKLFAIVLMMLAITFGTQSCSDDEETKPVEVSELQLSPGNATLLVNETVKLEAKVLPAEVADKSLTWTSSNSAVASVDNNGLVTALSVGETNISVSLVNHKGFEKTCAITVTEVRINLSESAVSMKTGETVTLTAAILPASVSQDVTWTSSDPNVATVANGVITAVSAGTATITATSAANSAVTAACAVTIEDEILPEISLSESAVSMKTGETVTLTAAIIPAEFSQEVAWASSDPSVATVDGGVITAIAAGTVTITATSVLDPEVTAECVVTIEIEEISPEINLNVSSVIVRTGGTYALAVAILPDSESQEVTWTSSDPSVATVDGGVITAVAAGTATITVTSATNSDITAECVVNVEDGTPTLVGLWNFEDLGNLSKATVGADLEASGEDYISIDGPDGAKAAKPGSKSKYKVVHGIVPNGGGSKVNEYTLMLDVLGSSSEFAGWLSVYNTRPNNSGEGVLWIDGGGYIGYATLGGYSNAVTLTPDTWHRVVIAAKLGESLKVYVDGQLAFNATQNIGVDELVSLPLDGFHIGVDGTNYPGPSFAEVRLWNIQLTDSEIEELGGAQ